MVEHTAATAKSDAVIAAAAATTAAATAIAAARAKHSHLQNRVLTQSKKTFAWIT